MPLIDELDRLTQRHAAGDITDEEYANLWSAALLANQGEAVGLPSTPPTTQIAARDPRHGIQDVTAPYSELLAPLPPVGSLRGGQDSARWRGPIATVVCALGMLGLLFGVPALLSPFRGPPFPLLLLNTASALALAAGFCTLIPSRRIYRIGLGLLLAAWLCGVGLQTILWLDGMFDAVGTGFFSIESLLCGLLNAPLMLLILLWLLRHRADEDARPENVPSLQDDS